MRSTRRGSIVLAAVVMAFAGAAQARELTLDQRVNCERVVEGVYWRYRIWPSGNPGAKPDLAAVLSEDALRAKVDISLRQSAALEMWGRPITADDLQAEMDRMARDTRSPERLGEIVSALHDDPLLVAECLVRPILADQRVGELLDADRAFADWWATEGESVPAQIVTSDAFTPMALSTTSACTNDTWTPTSQAGTPMARYGGVRIWTGSEVIVWGGIWPLNGQPLNNGGLYDPATDSWRPFTTGPQGYPGGGGLTGVWTGTRMIVWGGGYSGDFNAEDWNKGGRYDPAANAWQATSLGESVPSTRMNHSAVWTGTRMIVWGGGRINSQTTLNTGGIYDPATDTWAPTSIGLTCSGGTNPGQICNTSAECSGTCTGGATPGEACQGEVDCAGRCHNNISISCLTNTECQTQGLGLCNAPAPGNCPNAGSCLDLGGAYHPFEREGQSAVWTGSRMLIWGGATTGAPQPRTNTGALYDPATNTWTPTSTTNAPSPRSGHSSVWTGTALIVWGGGGTNTGGRYDPVSDTWTSTSTGAGVPSPRSGAGAVWTGDEMIVWGGNDSLNTGGRYRPATDTWTSTSTGANVPTGRSTSLAWTGSEVFVWGELNNNTSGARYCATPACAVGTWYFDSDGDGYGVSSVPVLSCTPPPGYSAASGDCNDAAAGVHPGVAEVCGDGVDNDCDGIADDATALARTSAMSVTAAGSISWSPITGANGYDVVRGSLGILASSHGNFALATAACLGNDLTSTSVSDPAVPATGQGTWYLVRGENCAGPGTFDSGAASQVGSRDAEILASGHACP